MSYTVPPPPLRPQYKETLQKMRPKTDVFFEDGNPASLKSIACRLSIAGRRYVTAQQNGGVRVWRTA